MMEEEDDEDDMMEEDDMGEEDDLEMEDELHGLHPGDGVQSSSPPNPCHPRGRRSRNPGTQQR
jgi:hypothetical protein